MIIVRYGQFCFGIVLDPSRRTAVQWPPCAARVVHHYDRDAIMIARHYWHRGAVVTLED